MKQIFVFAFALVLTATANAGLVKGIVLNDDDPYIVKSSTGDLYKVDWYSGSSLFSEGDFVILTTDYGSGQMISPQNEEVAEVWVEEIDD
jgi:hypothetical protein